MIVSRFRRRIVGLVGEHPLGHLPVLAAVDHVAHGAGPRSVRWRGEHGTEKADLAEGGGRLVRVSKRSTSALPAGALGMSAPCGSARRAEFRGPRPPPLCGLRAARRATTASAPSSRRDGRAVEGARLESVATPVSNPTLSAIQSGVAEATARPESESAGFGRIRGVWGGSGFGSPPETELLRGQWGALRRKFSAASFGGGLSGIGRRPLVGRLGLSLGANRPAATAPPAPTMRAGSRSASRAHRR